MASTIDTALPKPVPAEHLHLSVLGTLSASHFVNDMMQSLLFAIYPLLKGEFTLSFVELGFITLTYQITGSLLQPLIGIYTDRHPKPFAVSLGMGFTMLGLLTLAFAHQYAAVLLAATLVGIGSAIFHPESSRIARFASGGRHGLAQSIFQIGGNAGAAVGPLLAALIILPFGRSSVGWFALGTLLVIVLMGRVGLWYQHERRARQGAGRRRAIEALKLPTRTVAWSIAILLVLVISKYFYLASLTSYYMFYLMAKFHVSSHDAQFYLFVFLFAAAAGTMLGGPLGDRIGRKRVIWLSILGVAPFTLLLPFVNLTWTCVLTFVIGLIISSAFSAILVFAQELIPHRVGTVSGLFFGFAFGIGGVGAAVLGGLADHYGIETVYRLCAYLPLLGIVTAWLPNVRERAMSRRKD